MTPATRTAIATCQQGSALARTSASLPSQMMTWMTWTIAMRTPRTLRLTRTRMSSRRRSCQLGAGPAEVAGKAAGGEGGAQQRAGGAQVAGAGAAVALLLLQLQPLQQQHQLRKVGTAAACCPHHGGMVMPGCIPGASLCTCA